MVEQNMSQRFLECVTARDFDGLSAVLAPDVRARMLLPRGLEELSGRDEIIGRFRGWFASASHFESISTGHEAIGERHRLSWSLRVVRDSGSAELLEQHAIVDPGPAGIERLDLLCSGFQPQQAVPPSGERVIFDAGNLGCADGLAQEFRRRIAGVPVGASLAVVVADPAAKEDLPPLARMLGHAITSTQALDDGRLTITVERRK